MQQQELAQIRQREANLAALAAIGPRKKRKMDSPVRGASAEVRNMEPIGVRVVQINKEKVNKRINVSLRLLCFWPQGSGAGPSQPGGSGAASSRQFMRQRITRVNLKDLLFCLENERETSCSHLLYKGFLK